MISRPLIALCVSLTCISPAIAGDAVSSVNGKLQAMGGKVDGKDASAALGSLSLPVSSNFGVQVDALGGKVNSQSTQGYGLHAFWRDSEKGLLGLTGSQVKTGGNKMNRAGVEGEYYFPNVTVAG
jgi:hypothetical protein